MALDWLAPAAWVLGAFGVLQAIPQKMRVNT